MVYRITGLTAALLISILFFGAASADGIVSINSGDPNYGTFFSNSGFTYNNIFSNFTSSDIENSKLVILELDTSYTTDQLSALDTYVSNGGRLALITDEGIGSRDYYDAITAQNAVLASLGSDIINTGDGYDSEYSEYCRARCITSNIGTSIFTKGVSDINYVFTSDVVGGNELVTGLSGQGVVAEQMIGSGYVFALSDTDLADAIFDPSVGNGQLFLNFAEASPSAAPEPSIWTLMIAGVAMVGGMLRWRRRQGGLAFSRLTAQTGSAL